MTEKEIKKQTALQRRFLLSLVTTLRLNSKITDKEYSKIRNRILEDKEVQE